MSFIDEKDEWLRQLELEKTCQEPYGSAARPDDWSAGLPGAFDSAKARTAELTTSNHTTPYPGIYIGDDPNTMQGAPNAVPLPNVYINPPGDIGNYPSVGIPVYPNGLFSDKERVFEQLCQHIPDEIVKELWYNTEQASKNAIESGMNFLADYLLTYRRIDDIL